MAPRGIVSRVSNNPCRRGHDRIFKKDKAEDRKKECACLRVRKYDVDRDTGEYRTCYKCRDCGAPVDEDWAYNHGVY